MMSDRRIWGLSAESLLLHSYQLQCSSPVASTHNEASRQASLFTTIWLTFRHAQKRGNLSNTSVLVSTFVNLWEYLLLRLPRSVCVPACCTGMSFVWCLRISRRRKCRHEQRLTSACGRWSVGFQTRNADTYQITMSRHVRLSLQKLDPTCNFESLTALLVQIWKQLFSAKQREMFHYAFIYFSCLGWITLWPWWQKLKCSRK